MGNKICIILLVYLIIQKVNCSIFYTFIYYSFLAKICCFLTLFFIDL